MRIVATFESSAFTFPPENLIELAAPPGKDVALWLAARLRELGSEVIGEPEPEDFGWYITFSTEGELYQAVIGPNGQEFWYVVVEQVVGFILSVLGHRRKHKHPHGLLAVHNALKNANEANKLQWHSWEWFSRGGARAFDDGTDAPIGI